jgi:hypothetical protein
MAIHTPDTPRRPRHFGQYVAPPETPTPAPLKTEDDFRAEDIHTILVNRVALGAVAAGVFVALTVHLILNMLGLGLGVLAVSDVPVTADTVRQFSWTAALWGAASGILAAFAGGIAAGRMCGDPKDGTAIWHGLVAWAASVVVIAGLALGGAGVIASGSFGTLASLAQPKDTLLSSLDQLALGKGAPVAAANPPSLPVTTANAALPYAGAVDPAGATGTIRSNPDGSTNIDMIATPTPTPAIAANDIIPTLRGTEAADIAAVEPAAGETVAPSVHQGMTALAKASLVGAIALILGAIAAAFGGALGSVEPVVTNPAIRKYFH